MRPPPRVTWSRTRELAQPVADLVAAAEGRIGEPNPEGAGGFPAGACRLVAVAFERNAVQWQMTETWEVL